METIKVTPGMSIYDLRYVKRIRKTIPTFKFIVLGSGALPPDDCAFILTGPWEHKFGAVPCSPNDPRRHE